MPSDNVGSLFEPCWRQSPDPDQIAERIHNDNHQMIRQCPGFLVKKHQLTTQKRPGTGLTWQIAAANSDTPLAGLGRTLERCAKTGRLEIAVPPGASLLRLNHKRALGTARISGTLVVQSVQIKVRR